MRRAFLIVKTSAVGDVIAALDVVAYLRRRDPTAQIDWVVERAASSLIEAHPDIERTLVMETKRWRKAPFAPHTKSAVKTFIKSLRSVYYDAIFDLQGNTKSGLVTLLSKGRDKVGFSLRAVAELPNVLATHVRYFIPKNEPVRTKNLKLVQRYFEDETSFTPSPISFFLTEAEKERLSTFPKGSAVMVCMHARWKNKQLSEEALVQLIHTLLDAQVRRIVLPYGSEEEMRKCDSLKQLFPHVCYPIGEMSLPLWQALMQQMELIITVDSAALHLAATTSTPTFCYFGPSSPAVYNPSGERRFAVQGACPYHERFDARCKRLRTCATGACMMRFTGKESALLDALKNLKF